MKILKNIMNTNKENNREEKESRNICAILIDDL